MNTFLLTYNGDQYLIYYTSPGHIAWVVKNPQTDNQLYYPNDLDPQLRWVIEEEIVRI